RGGDATAPAVPTAVRDRDELPAEEPGRGEYDQSEPGLSSLPGRRGLPAASGVGRAHRANCPEPASQTGRLGQRVDPDHIARLACPCPRKPPPRRTLNPVGFQLLGA